MTANDDQDNGQPPTTVAANGDETEIGLIADETELVPPLTVAAPELAWSRDQENYAGGFSWGRTAERASIIVVAAAAVALVIGFLTGR